MDRTAFFHKGLSRAMRGIEIGPSYRPLCPKGEGWNVLVVDHADKPALTAKYAAWKVDTSRIEDVDLVLGDAGIATITPKGGYDFLVASHVIEHIPNPIGFFRDAADLLRPGGRLRLAVPDKRYSFDLLKPVSTAGQLIQAYVENRHRHTLGQIVDALMLHMTCNGSINFTAVKPGDTLALPHAPAEAYRIASQAVRSPEHYDVHGWVYTPSSFAVVCRQLTEIGLLPFRIDSLVPDNRHEFLVDAVKDDSGATAQGLDVIAALREAFLEQAAALGKVNAKA